MKIWLKYLIGVALGIALSFAAPLQSAQVRGLVDFCTALALRIGRYMVIPLVFAGAASAIFALRDSKHLLKAAGLSLGVTALSSLLLSVIGTVSVLLVRLPRIPVSVEKAAQAPAFNVKDAVLSIFPYSPAEALLNGAFLLPVFVFACLFGAACVEDKAKSKPAVTLLESLEDVFYAAMSFVMDIMPIGMIAVACSWSIDYFGVIASGQLTPLIIMLSAVLAFVLLVVYPLLFFFLCRGHHPFRILYACLGPVIAAFFSGDTNFTLPFLIRHGTESLGIKRRIHGFVFPFMSIFARGGSAMTLAVSFVVILRTYSPIGISFGDVLWVAAASFGLSFLLCSYPTGGAYIALAALCSMYGKGFEAVYLLLRPAAAVICAYAAAIDAATVMFGSFIVAVKLKMAEHRDVRKYI